MDTKVLAKLDKIVEATKVAVSHALRISGDSLRVEWRTNSFEPTLAYPSTYRVSAQDWEPSSPGGNDKKAMYAMDSASSGHVVRTTILLDETMTENRATLTWPQIMYVLKIPKEIAVKQYGAEALPQTYPATRPLTVSLVRMNNMITAAKQKTTKNLSNVDEVVINSSTHER